MEHELVVDQVVVQGVFVARQNRAVFVPVVTGVAGERYFEALSGVAEADRVITGPYSEVRNLEDGDEIRVVDGDGQQEARLGGLRGFLGQVRTGASSR